MDYSKLSRVSDSFSKKKVSDSCNTTMTPAGVEVYFGPYADADFKDLTIDELQELINNPELKDDTPAFIAVKDKTVVASDFGEGAGASYKEYCSANGCDTEEDIEDSAKPAKKDLKKYKPSNNKDVKDSKKSFAASLRSLRVSDSYQSLKKRIKDDLDETQSTDEVIEVITNYLDEAPVEEVVPAAIEVISEAVDTLQEKLDAQQELNGGEGEEAPVEDPEDDEPNPDEVQDSLRKKRIARIQKHLRDSRK